MWLMLVLLYGLVRWCITTDALVGALTRLLAGRLTFGPSRLLDNDNSNKKIGYLTILIF